MQPLVAGISELATSANEDWDIGKLLPVFIPTTLVEAAGWPGPFANLPAPGVAMAWALLLADDTIRYVLHDIQQGWEAQGIDWRRRALRNLSELSPEPLGTGALFRENGETWLISLMYPDGLGPSRLLLTHELERVFPNGYQVALPERNRAFAFARDLDREDADTVQSLIERSYLGSDRRLSAGILDPAQLAG
jgi:hypothetical protein